MSRITDPTDNLELACARAIGAHDFNSIRLMYGVVFNDELFENTPYRVVEREYYAPLQGDLVLAWVLSYDTFKTFHKACLRMLIGVQTSDSKLIRAGLSRDTGT